MIPERPLHAGAWLLWVAAALVLLTVTRNPIYIGLALLWVGITLIDARRAPLVPGLRLLSPLRFGLIVVPTAALLNALFVHVGSTHLIVLPHSWPLIGGPITAEALVYGALNGLILTGIFTAFTVFNLMTPVRALVRLVPRAYYPVAVTLAIAVTFVPVTLRQAEQIREAQAVRGARLRGLRAWLPLFLPLLSSGLERALQLAEAMVARGFATGTHSGTEEENAAAERAFVRTQILLLLGILTVVAAWLLGIAGLPAGAAGSWGRLALLSVGLLLVVGALRLSGRAFRHTIYRPQPWSAGEWAVTAAAALTAALFLLPLPGIDRSSLAWTPYPTLTWPAFSPLFGVATWGLLGPLLLGLGARPQ
jgi:energy-coupling factor transport system permease protein